MISDVREAGAQDRNNDGVIDYLNTRIYVADDPTPAELAAAANIAARLAFETTSMDLPIGFPVSAYAPSGKTAIIVGRAAKGVTNPNIIAIPDPKKAEAFARSLGLNAYTRGASSPLPATPRSLAETLAPSRVVLGPDVRSTRVIDLAARIALESAELRLPLVTVATGEARGELPRHAILVGRTNPWLRRLVREGKFAAPLAPGSGRIEIIGDAVAIAGADSPGEHEALQHAAERLPYVWHYGKGHRSLADVEDEIRRFHPSLDPDPVTIIDYTWDIPWEVDEARRRIETSVFPSLRPGQAVEVELRLSESFEVRRALTAEIRESLTKRGSDGERTTVRILCAHKQGYSWIDEQLKPGLKNAARIRIAYRELKCEDQSVDCPDRWLQELYPIDEVLARDLHLPVDRITFERRPPGEEHVYSVVAEDARGRTILHAVFDPCSVSRPLFDLFPDYAHARVSTGWIRASIDGNLVADERIPADYETFWDEYQSRVLPMVRDHVLRLYDGKPLPESAPHFDELAVDVALSEPDFHIGIDQERISTLEALHEDIYFETLLFLDVLGTATCGKPLSYAGRIIPRVRKGGEGKGRGHVRLTGRHTPAATEAPFRDAEPRITAVTVREGHSRPVALEVSAAAAFCWLLPESAAHPAIEPKAASAPLVQCSQPIGPDECARIIESLACFPAVRPYLAGRSWLGRPVWAMDVMAPVDGKYFSQARACATKPCLFITGRQHANEVSSTSHILKLVEALATDPQYRGLLDRVNFVIQPIANPDGAGLVDELHKLMPDFMLHAGYLGALGVDITHQQWANVPKYPEARVRADLWRMWLPDIVLNPHGYPSHEWVQLFAGYSAWVRSKDMIARDWWIPRGWFMPRFEYIDHDAFPQHRAAAFVLRDKIAESIDRVLGPINSRMYRRYAKYTGAQLELHNGVLICAAPACEPDARSFGFMTRYPEVTFFEGLSEAPDEVATGEWLETLVAAGLEFSLAHARFLAEQPNAVEHTFSDDGGRLVLGVSRRRL